jgi:hypothetical protein
MKECYPLNKKVAIAFNEILSSHNGETISTLELRHDYAKKLWPISSYGWERFANDYKIQYLQKKKVGKGSTLTFSVKKLQEKLNNLYPQIDNSTEVTNCKTVTVAWDSRNTMDDVLRDFNATIDSLHHENQNQYDEVMEKMNQLLNAFRALFKRQSELSNKHEALMKAFESVNHKPYYDDEFQLQRIVSSNVSVDKTDLF